MLNGEDDNDQLNGEDMVFGGDGDTPRLAALFRNNRHLMEGCSMTYALTQYREKLILFIFTLCLFTASATQAAPWVLERADTPDPVNEEQITELENKAKDGDWQLKEEFAAAYLYETSYPQIYGCKRLKYGDRCRAMAKRVGSASIFLREIIDTAPKTEGERIGIGTFQADYAGSLPFKVSSDPVSSVCREAIHYYELAVRNGQSCTARRLESMAHWGVCMEKNEERAKAYHDLIPNHIACPTP